MEQYAWFTPGRDLSPVLMLLHSGPIRRIGDRLLDPIPLEIYQEVFEYLCENDDMSVKELRRTLSNMALVCRFFSAIALPKLFAKVYFSGRPGPEVSRTSQFCRALNNNQEPEKSLAKHVKACTFIHWPTATACQASQVAFFTMYCSALSKMTSVESIAFYNVAITKRILKSVKKLCLVNSLSFSECSLVPEVDLDQFTNFLQTLRLRFLTIIENKSSESRIFSNAISPALPLHNLIWLEVDNWSIIQRLSELDHPLPLQTLAIFEVEDSALLPKLFRQTPHLLHLYIGTMESGADSSTPVQFTDHLLPKLSSFQGTLSLATLLIPQRPVKKVSLMGYEASCSVSTQQVWEALTKSKAPIRELFIPEYLYCAASLRDCLPNVQVVKLSWCHSNPDDIVPALEPASEYELKQVISSGRLFLQTTIMLTT